MQEYSFQDTPRHGCSFQFKYWRLLERNSMSWSVLKSVTGKRRQERLQQRKMRESLIKWETKKVKGKKEGYEWYSGHERN
jgi:hypothetical protein